MGKETALKIESKCPNCKTINKSLYTYQILNEPNIMFDGDFVMTFINNSMGFIRANNICIECDKKYYMKVGVKNSKLTSIVIVEKDGD